MNFYVPEPRPIRSPQVGQWVQHRERQGKAFVTAIKQDHYKVLWGGLKKGTILKANIKNYTISR